MSKNKKLSNIMIEECVKVEKEASAYDMMRLRNLNVFLYQEISRLRTENKSLKNRMVGIKFMARKEPHARKKSKDRTGIHEVQVDIKYNFKWLKSCSGYSLCNRAHFVGGCLQVMPIFRTATYIKGA
eukprot:Gb_39891 [translate_table: standard]